MGLASEVTTTGYISLIWFMELVQDFVHAMDQDFKFWIPKRHLEGSQGPLEGSKRSPEALRELLCTAKEVLKRS